jgi:hypothetical protein
MRTLVEPSSSGPNESVLSMKNRVLPSGALLAFEPEKRSGLLIR